jgi:hypothetical protein
VTATRPLPAPDIDIPDPERIRAAIDAADERARLLRRLLRVALRLRCPAPTTDAAPAPVRQEAAGATR